ncbi:SHOCT domain-containing protein [Arthrobacter sp.]|uniref:SHOCT domain-containing protein n=1 Tax=Arthrobacter sp. TaxID=1667 RepID=UPI003A908BB4
MTQYTAKWKPEKAEKKKAAAKTALFVNEDIWFLGICNNFKPFASEFALTPLRLVALDGSEIKFQARYQDIASLTTNEKKETVEIVLLDGNITTLKMVPKQDHGAIGHYFNYGRSTRPAPDLLDTATAATAEETAMANRVAAAESSSWPRSTVRGPLSKKASLAIQRQCHGDEYPWLILTSSAGAGSLVAFDDRMAIIKTGAWASFMAGSLGGERSATFNFTDITGIEYNSGFINGVLEVLTPSYSGSANRDFWRGSTQSRNADSNDPWTLSNCLPLDKSEYTDYLKDINELKARISKSKQLNVQVIADPTPVGGGLVEQLEKLAGLRDSGVLSDDEFAAAKARLLAQ